MIWLPCYLFPSMFTSNLATGFEIFAVNIVDHDLRASKGVELIELVSLFSYIL